MMDLVFRSLAGSLSGEEQAQLKRWLGEVPGRRDWYEQLVSTDLLTQALQQQRPELVRSAALEVHEHIRENTGITTPLEGESVSRVHFLKTAWFRYAAVIIILFGIGAYLWNKQNNSSTITQTQPVPIKSDVLPGGQKAVLTLADGRTITLDSAANGQLAIENGSEVIKKDGQIIYGAGQLNNIDVTFNTMSTPKGGQYQLTLSDGTKVWLNAASSITYPTVFNGKTREVKITGEVYFEVRQNKDQPFIVEAMPDEITVLGTSFNVNAYEDESHKKISLLEGSIRIASKILQPGQAYLDGQIITTDVQQDVAWKYGAFNFTDTDIEAAFRQLARWYNVDIKYAGGIPSKKLRGKMGRNLTLTEVLKAFSGVGINTQIEGSTLIVLPK